MDKITFLVVLKNLILNNKLNLFKKIMKQANRLSSNFLIVNNNSKDDTKKIIFNLKKYLRFNLEYYEDKRKEFDYLKYEYSKKIKADYIFVLDDDEFITNNLLDEIKKNINKKYKLFIFKWNTYLLNNCITNSKKPILFSRKFNILNNTKEIHKQFNWNKIRTLNNDYIYKSKNEIKHFSFLNVKNLFKKTDFYSKYEAEKLFEKNPNLSNFKVFFLFLNESFIYFFGSLFLQKGWKNLISFFYCFNSVIYRWKKYIFYLELKYKYKK